MKRVFLGLAVVALAMTSHASYLYWQVNSSDSTFNGNTITGYRVVASGANSAALDTYAYNPTASTYQKVSTATTVNGSEYVSNQGGEVARATAQSPYLKLAANLNGLEDGYSYYIEIIGHDTSKYGDGTGVLGISEVMTYAQANSHITETLQSISSVPTAWTGGTYAAPEPTSGLLLLVGASLLALKRRKV